MSEKRIVVPDGMVEAVTRKEVSLGLNIHSWSVTAKMLEEAMLWLSENPIVPTLEQTEACRRLHRYTMEPLKVYQQVAVEWQRRMFLAPEPEVPEELKDLLWSLRNSSPCDMAAHNQQIIEAYQRGLKAAKE